MTTERIEVQRQIAAPPEKIFAVVSRPSGHVAIDASGMLQSAGDDPVTAVGDEFTVQMDRESLNDFPLGKYEVTVVITQFEPNRTIEWTIGAFGMPPFGHLYGYQLAPSEGGTLVTAYYDWSKIEKSPERDDLFPVIQETGIRATLGILARTVEP
jgi:Polyketide cyclase / dehydrase and lipid transport